MQNREPNQQNDRIDISVSSKTPVANLGQTKATQSELLRKYKGKDASITLDRALRRAAGFGSSEDVLALINLGANVNSQGADGQTSLHWAVKKSKNQNIKILLEKNASLHIADNEGITPATLLNIDQENGFIHPDLFAHWSKYFSIKELQRLRLVNTRMNQLVLGHITHLLNLITSSEKQAVEQLPIELKYYILSLINNEGFSSRLQILTKALVLPIAARKEFLIENLLFDLSKIMEGRFTNAIVIALCTNLISSDDLINYTNLPNSEHLITILTENLMKKEDFKLFRHSGSSTGPHDTLGSLLSVNGINALRLKLIEIKDAPYIQDLRGMLSNEGFKFFRTGHISTKLIAAMCKKNGYLRMGDLINPATLKLFEEGIVSFKSFDSDDAKHVQDAFKLYKSLPFFKDNFIQKIIKENLADCNQLIRLSSLDVAKESLYYSLKEGHVSADKLYQLPQTKGLFSKNGLMALREGLITFNQAITIKKLDSVFSISGLHALRKGLITIADINPILEYTPNTYGHPSNKNNLTYLFSDTGIKALELGFVTLEDAKSVSLALLDIPNALIALKEKLITLNQAKKFDQYGNVFQAKSLKVLLSNIGLQALREKLLTPEEAAEFYHSGYSTGPHDNLEKLLNEVGIVALKEKLIKAGEATNIALDALFQNKNPDIIAALKLKLVSVDDFRLTNYNSAAIHPLRKAKDIVKATKELIAEHNKKLLASIDSQVGNQKASKIQSVWKGYVARSQLTLFKSLKTIIKHDNFSIHKLNDVLKAKELAEQGKIHEAKKQITNIMSSLKR